MAYQNDIREEGFYPVQLEGDSIPTIGRYELGAWTLFEGDGPYLECELAKIGKRIDPVQLLVDGGFW